MNSTFLGTLDHIAKMANTTFLKPWCNSYAQEICLQLLYDSVSPFWFQYYLLFQVKSAKNIDFMNVTFCNIGTNEAWHKTNLFDDFAEQLRHCPTPLFAFTRICSRYAHTEANELFRALQKSDAVLPKSLATKNYLGQTVLEYALSQNLLIALRYILPALDAKTKANLLFKSLTSESNSYYFNEQLKQNDVIHELLLLLDDENGSCTFASWFSAGNQDFMNCVLDYCFGLLSTRVNSTESNDLQENIIKRLLNVDIHGVSLLVYLITNRDFHRANQLILLGPEISRVNSWSWRANHITIPKQVAHYNAAWAIFEYAYATVGAESRNKLLILWRTLLTFANTCILNEPNDQNTSLVCQIVQDLCTIERPDLLIFATSLLDRVPHVDIFATTPSGLTALDTFYKFGKKTKGNLLTRIKRAEQQTRLFYKNVLKTIIKTTHMPLVLVRVLGDYMIPQDSSVQEVVEKTIGSKRAGKTKKGLAPSKRKGSRNECVQQNPVKKQRRVNN